MVCCKIGLLEKTPGPDQCQTRLAPMEQLKDTAAPISQAGGVHVKTYLKRAKNALWYLCEKELEKCEKNSLVDTKARRRRRRCSRGWNRFPYSQW